jgi:transposase
MSKTRGKYTEDFKEMIVELYNTAKTAKEIESEYGVSGSTLNKWVHLKKKIKIEDEEMSAEQIRELKKENNKLKMENELLKKVTAIFAQR